jgi:hypothetical protein
LTKLHKLEEDKDPDNETLLADTDEDSLYLGACQSEDNLRKAQRKKSTLWKESMLIT